MVYKSETDHFKSYNYRAYGFINPFAYCSLFNFVDFKTFLLILFGIFTYVGVFRNLPAHQTVTTVKESSTSSNTRKLLLDLQDVCLWLIAYKFVPHDNLQTYFFISRYSKRV